MFLIAHPDGPGLLDTGFSPRWNDPGYVSNFSTVKFVTRVSINPGNGIGKQIEKVGASRRVFRPLSLVIFTLTTLAAWKI